MNISIEKLPKSQVKLTIEVPEDRMEGYLEKAALKISEHVKIPGFRPGHVPLNVLKEHVHEEALINQALDEALPETYTEAVFEKGLQVISRPKIELKSTKPLVYEAIVAVYPPIKVKGYEKIRNR